MAVPVACQHGAGLRAGRDQGRQGHLLDRLAEVALRAERRSPATLGMPRRQGPRDLGDRARLLRPQRRRRLPRWTPRVLAKAVGKPVRLQYTRDQGTGWDPKGPASIHRARAAIDANGKVIAYEFISKGFSRVDVNTNGQQADRHAGRPDPRHRAAIGRRLRRAGGILRVRQQADGVGDDPAAARPRLAAAHLASARSGRAADPLRQRVVHGRGGGGARRRSGRVPAALRQGPARHRGDQGGGREVRLGDAAVAAHATRPATRSRAAASPMRSATAPASRSSPRSRSTARPARSGRASSPSRTTAARSSTRRLLKHASRATSCRASAARCGKR